MPVLHGLAVCLVFIPGGNDGCGDACRASSRSCRIQTMGCQAMQGFGAPCVDHDSTMFDDWYTLCILTTTFYSRNHGFAAATKEPWRTNGSSRGTCTTTREDYLPDLLRQNEIVVVGRKR